MVIFQPLVYLVSFILKVWHLFFTQVLHLRPLGLVAFDCAARRYRSHRYLLLLI